ncbi:reverse transcriptase domain-containing protein [Moritella sp. JT01]|uniref:reverse transcriptase domain-containing protein n=1 Tax=Moritella sp. JT01 TaxID=756698 RepID=UPI003518B911
MKRRQASTIGTPQGSVISPLLANVYLHYSFDLWLNQYRKSTRGEVTIIRYADPAVLGFQKHQDAKKCLAALVKASSSRAYQRLWCPF